MLAQHIAELKRHFVQDPVEIWSKYGPSKYGQGLFFTAGIIVHKKGRARRRVPDIFYYKIRQKASAYSSARSTKFSTNRKVHTQRIGWISFVCFLQIFTIQ